MGYAGSGAVSLAERLQLRREFEREMQRRFLSGEDGEFADYRDIDADISLDDHWLEQTGRDAEEQYFDGD